MKLFIVIRGVAPDFIFYTGCNFRQAKRSFRQAKRGLGQAGKERGLACKNLVSVTWKLGVLERRWQKCQG